MDSKITEILEYALMMFGKDRIIALACDIHNGGAPTVSVFNELWEENPIAFLWWANGDIHINKFY